MKVDSLTPERLRELLHYDPDAGSFIWIKTNTNRLKAGEPAGTVDRAGYLRIMVDGVRYGANRLAWLYVTGEWPSGEIDHINRDPSDNRLGNLRDVPHVVNVQNQVRPHQGNKYRGVSLHHGRYKARIGLNRKVLCLGTFDTPEEARAAYLAERARLHPGAVLVD